MRLIYTLLLLAFGLTHAQSAPPSPAKLYAVIFEVTVDSAGKLTLKGQSH